MKTYIEDVVLKMDGGQEAELPTGTCIRFEDGKNHYCVELKEDGLHVYKINGSVSIRAVASNTLIIN